MKMFTNLSLTKDGQVLIERLTLNGVSGSAKERRQQKRLGNEPEPRVIDRVITSNVNKRLPLKAIEWLGDRVSLGSLEEIEKQANLNETNAMYGRVVADRARRDHEEWLAGFSPKPFTKVMVKVTPATLCNVAQAALEIHTQHDEAAEFDAGFDGGEFSGPAHDRMAEREVEELAAKYGYTFEEVNREMMRLAYEGMNEPGQDPAASSYLDPEREK